MKTKSSLHIHYVSLNELNMLEPLRSQMREHASTIGSSVPVSDAFEQIFPELATRSCVVTGYGELIGVGTKTPLNKMVEMLGRVLHSSDEFSIDRLKLGRMMLTAIELQVTGHIVHVCWHPDETDA